jgi:DNA invertase Pin-like site-specific DNA recombinase
MKVFLYERVSSEEQVRHGYSLDAQDEALKQFCEKNGHVVLGVYRDEGISARKPYTKRPAMVQLLNDLEQVKPDIILFTKLDRWFRNIKEYYKVQDILDRNKVNWKAINEEYDTSTASGRLYVNIKLSIAQDEADRTSERIRDIQGQLIAQGKFLGGSLPLGYKLENKHIVFSDDIKIVKEAIDYFTLHQSAYSTAQYINEKYDLSYSSQSLINLLRHPLLKGEYHNQPNYCEALLTDEEWSALQSITQRNIKKASKKRAYLFSGLIKCPCCGCNMGGVTTSGIKYYRCNKKFNSTCDMPHNIREQFIEEWLLENVEENFRVNVTMKPKEQSESPNKYKERLSRLNDMYLMGNITQEEYKAKSADLQKKIAELSKKPVLKTQNFSANWHDLYHELDEEKQRAFWHGLLSEIVVDVAGQVVRLLY